MTQRTLSPQQKQEADQKLVHWRIKQAEINRGVFTDDMESGIAWSGWYGTWYFRSIAELSYVLQLERMGKKWEGAEQERLVIQYTDTTGKGRNHFCDIFVEDKELIEVKPFTQWKDPTVIRKAEAAKEFCQLNNLVYKMVSPKKMTEEALIELYVADKIALLPRYEKILQTIIKKRNEKASDVQRTSGIVEVDLGKRVYKRKKRLGTNK